MNVLFSIANFIMRPIVRLVFRLRCRGIENIPKSGALIIASNHINALDIFFISAFVPRSVRFLAKAELFKNPLMKFFFKAAGAIPIDRGSVGTEPIKEVLKALRGGKVVGIFPQGTRCKGVNPRETRIKSGVGMIAYHSCASVLPVFIGADGMKAEPFRRTDIYFGEPIGYNSLGFSGGGAEEYRNATDIIFDKICSLPEKYREEGGK